MKPVEFWSARRVNDVEWEVIGVVPLRFGARPVRLTVLSVNPQDCTLVTTDGEVYELEWSPDGVKALASIQRELDELKAAS